MSLGADSDEKLCKLVSEFGRVCKRKKLRMNVAKSKVMRCSKYRNGRSNACNSKLRTVTGSGLF